MSELFLIRHGQASFQSDDYDRLNDTGRKQVQALAEYWHSLGERFDAIYSGSLRRQQETANGLLPVIADQNVTVLDGLNEYASAAILTKYRDEFAASDGLDAAADLKDLRTFQRFLERACGRWINKELAGGDIEAFDVFKQRVQDALRTVMANHPRGQRVVVASSGGAIAMMVQHILELTDAQAVNLHWLMYNASITRIRFSGARRSLAVFNAIPHLERPGHGHMITYR